MIEVRAVSKIGILHRITKALTELGLDIRHATVQTIGMEVVDTFYVRTRSGELVTEPPHRKEIRRRSCTPCPDPVAVHSPPPTVAALTG